MSEGYWKIWNPKVQAKIDADIEANRKADAVINLGDVPAGTEVKMDGEECLVVRQNDILALVK